MSVPLKLTRLTGFDRNKSSEYSQSTVSVGTDAGSDVRFDATWDKTVSPQHGQFVLEHGTWWFADQSKDGTLLDGRQIKRQKLTPGAVLELGPGGPKLKVEWTPAPVAPPPAPSLGQATTGSANQSVPAAQPAQTRQPLPVPPVPPRPQPTARPPGPSAPPTAANKAPAQPSSPTWIIAVVAVMLAVAAGAAW